jgi:hypothetical protein
LPIYREVGDRQGEAATLLGYGSSLAATRSDSAAAVLEDAARIYALLGRHAAATTVRDRLAELARADA